MNMEKRDELQLVRQKMSVLANSEIASHSKNYLKSDYAFYGLRVPQQRKIAKEFKDLEFYDALNFFEELWNSGNHEEMSVALFILGNYSKEKEIEIWNFLMKRVEKAKSWDHIDWIGTGILGKILARNIQLVSEIKKLSESRNPWMRRLSIVSTLGLIKKGMIELTFRLAEKLVYDENTYVQKGAGWMLREAGKKNRNAVRQFILTHYKMKPLSLSYATEKMTDLRKVIKEQKQKEKEEKLVKRKENDKEL